LASLSLLVFTSTAESCPISITPHTIALSPDVADQFQRYLPQVKDFVAFNVAGLRSGPLLQSPPVLALSPLRGMTADELETVKKNLAYFGVTDLSKSAEVPNFLFVMPESAADLRRILIALGLPPDQAGVQWSVYLSSRDDCYLQTLDIGGGPGELAVSVARADSTTPKPYICLNNTVLNALGLSRGLEQFGPVQPGLLARVVDADFINRVNECKLLSSVTDVIADCVSASYQF
jgi:hypothetical protein